MKWYKSRGVWGGIVASAASAATIFGVAFAPEELEQATVELTAAGSLIGGLVSAYGRWKAKRAIT